MQAETLSAVRQKLKYTAGEKGDGMSMLVAEDAANPGGLLGCVDVSIQTGKVLGHRSGPPPSLPTPHTSAHRQRMLQIWAPF